jgi:hypothetical protein
MKTSMPPAWFLTTLETCLAQTYSLCLPGSPGADVLPATAATWADDLWSDPRFAWADPDTDRARIAHAFRQLRRTSERWPSLADFCRALPPPPEAPALKHEPCSPEQAARNVERLKAMVEEMFGSKA